MLIFVFTCYNRSILLGLIIGYVVHIICGVTGVGYPVDFSEVESIAWVRGPRISKPIIFDKQAISAITPLVTILVAENIGHIKAISSLTNQPMEKYLGRAYLGDALSTLMAGCVGSAPLTTYAENIGVLVCHKRQISLIYELIFGLVSNTDLFTFGHSCGSWSGYYIGIHC